MPGRIAKFLPCVPLCSLRGRGASLCSAKETEHTRAERDKKMESSVGGLPGPSVSLDRLPSFAESESTFSTVTDAESEITEASITPRQTYFLCYATDCLSAYELIKKRSQSGVRALDDVSSRIHICIRDGY